MFPGKAFELFTQDRAHPGLSEWMAEHTKFPSSTVDRITPATTADVITGLADEFGVRDRWPVVFTEAYRWALDSLHRDGARATLEGLRS